MEVVRDLALSAMLVSTGMASVALVTAVVRLTWRWFGRE
jgi:hypothetical protein